MSNTKRGISNNENRYFFNPKVSCRIAAWSNNKSVG